MGTQGIQGITGATGPQGIQGIQGSNANAWNLTGNAGTIATTNFIGTTDNNDIVFKRNNILAGTIGASNTSYGISSLRSIGTGLTNTAIGFNALRTNSTGNNNTSIGGYTLYSNTIGTDNNANGYFCLFSNTTGSRNVASGSECMQNNTLGFGNSAYGDGSLAGNTSGDRNTAIGYSSLTTNTTGLGNSAFGYLANVSTVALTYSTSLGYNAIANASSKVRIGGTNVGVIEGQVAYSFPSDARFKYNIQENVPGLNFIKALKPVTYNFDTKKFDIHLMQNMPDSIQKERMKNNDYTESSNMVHSGFLAQDIEVACKKLGYNFDGLHIPDVTNKTDNYSVAYSQFIMPLVKGMQEQQNIIETLQKQNEILQKQNAAILMRLEKLENK